MEENNIFPDDILHNTVEYHIAKHSKKTNLVFWLIFLVLISVFISLPFIYIDVTTTSPASITSIEKPVSIYSSTGGRITYFNLIENKTVKKGDILLIISQKTQDAKDELLNEQKEDALGFISDLEYLIKGKHSHVETSKYRKALEQYKQELSSASSIIENAQTNYDRTYKLYGKDIATKVELQDAKHELDRAKDNRASIANKTKASWEIELIDYRQSLDNLNSNKKQLQEERDMKIITASIDGDLINVQPFNEGSLVNPGTSLATISPNKNLIVESYIEPKDIGYIKEGLPGKYQVHSYDSNQWGFATGEIIEVGKDIITINNRPTFKVRSSLKEKELSLSNGAKGTLKKGMTVTSRFFLIRRSLFQLLFDNIDDWFNPYKNKNE